jgi:putative selenate reductase molybdopterin-binding subunit
MPAIGNAVFHATGVRVTDAPLSPEKILRGLRELEQNPEAQTATVGAAR